MVVITTALFTYYPMTTVGVEVVGLFIHPVLLLLYTVNDGNRETKTDDGVADH